MAKPPRNPAGLLVTPGASADRDHHTLVALEARLAPIPVGRWDFPAARAGRRGTDRPAVAVASVVEGVGRLAGSLKRHPAELVIGGRSFGGRMCSMAAAEVLTVAGLVLLSYPLHPPGKPDKQRVEHFDRLTVPCLFVSGTRDAFGTRDELEAATASIPGPVTHRWIEGGDHGMGRHDDAVADAVGDWLEDTFR